MYHFKKSSKISVWHVSMSILFNINASNNQNWYIMYKRKKSYKDSHTYICKQKHLLMYGQNYFKMHIRIFILKISYHLKKCVLDYLYISKHVKPPSRASPLNIQIKQPRKGYETQWKIIYVFFCVGIRYANVLNLSIELIYHNVISSNPLYIGKFCNPVP